MAPSCSPRRGAACGSGSGSPSRWYGRRGRGRPSGPSRYTPRATTCSLREDGLAVVHGRHGDAQRRRGVDDLLDPVMRHEAVDDLLPLRRCACNGPASPANRGSSRRSVCSMRIRKFWNCVAVLVLKPTKPSRARSIDGVSTLRDGPMASGRPRQWFARSPNTEPAIAIASASERSMCSPTPVRRRACSRDDDGRRAVQPADVLGEAAAGLHRVARRLAPEQHRARLGLHDEVGGQRGSDSGPPAPNGEIDSTTRCGCRERTPSTSKRPGPKLSTTMSASASSASTCASPGSPTTERLPALR